MPSRILFVLLVIFVSKISFSQTVSAVRVFDVETKIPLQDVVVQVNRTTIFSDENGLINIRSLILEGDSLKLSKSGYLSRSFPLVNLQYPSRIYLTKKITSLADINIASGSFKNVFKSISDLDIHLRPVNNSQELLRMVPGLFIGQHAGGGKAEQIFLRGFDLDHGTDINISADGIPVNMVSHAHGQGYADLHFIIPELIDKINFNKGPYFSEKGNFTTAGFVDFKIKNYLADDFVKIEAGQNNSLRLVTGINLLKPGDGQKNRSLFIAGECSYTDGYFEDPQHFNRFNTLLKYHASVSRSSVVSFSATAFSSKWKASGQIPDRALANGITGFYGAIDNTEGGNTSRYNLNAELQTNVSGEIVIRQQLYYSRYHYNLFSNFTFFKQDSINGDQIRQHEGRNIYGYNGSFQKFNNNHRIKTETNAGLQLRYDDIHNIRLDHTKDRVIIIDEIKKGDIRELNIGSYWSQRFVFSEKLKITTGARADYFLNRYADQINNNVLSSSKLIISPKINFSYQLNRQIGLYVYSGKGFHSNDTRVAVLENNKKVVPAAYGVDFGAVLKPGKKLFLQTALWYLSMQQEFVYVGDEGVVEAGGKSRRMGLDLSVRYELANNIYADADVSIADPRAREVERFESHLPLAPLFTSTGGITYKKSKGWNGSLRYRYMANRPANETYTVVARGYFITDASVNYISKKWEAGLAIQNLLNKKWKETQFDTESRLSNENLPVSEIHFTPGTPLSARLSFIVFF